MTPVVASGNYIQLKKEEVRDLHRSLIGFLDHPASRERWLLNNVESSEDGKLIIKLDRVSPDRIVKVYEAVAGIVRDSALDSYYNIAWNNLNYTFVRRPGQEEFSQQLQITFTVMRKELRTNHG